jgi:hypothetical protein
MGQCQLKYGEGKALSRLTKTTPDLSAPSRFMKLKNLAFIALLFGSISLAFGAPGELDPTFNGNGILNPPFWPINSLNERSTMLNADTENFDFAANQ